MSVFYSKLQQAWNSQNSLLCVGLDPNPDLMPQNLARKPDCLFRFNREIIDATAPYVCAYKPQIAYYAARGCEDQLQKTIDYIKHRYPELVVILDAKRGDIGTTAKMYALEAFERYEADAVTVNPYMGGDTLTPFLAYQDRGVIVLCRTSNPGSGEFQDRESQGKPLYLQVAQAATELWNGNQNVGLVVGATYPEQLGSVRQIVGSMPLLVPGIGSQGGDLGRVLKYGLLDDQTGLTINVSRAVIHADAGDQFAEKAGLAANRINTEIQSYRHKRSSGIQADHR